LGPKVIYFFIVLRIYNATVGEVGRGGTGEHGHNNHAAVVVACCIWGDHLGGQMMLVLVLDSDLDPQTEETSLWQRHSRLPGPADSSVSMLAGGCCILNAGCWISDHPWTMLHGSLVCGTHAPSSAPRNALHEMQNVSSGGPIAWRCERDTYRASERHIPQAQLEFPLFSVRNFEPTHKLS